MGQRDASAEVDEVQLLPASSWEQSPSDDESGDPGWNVDRRGPGLLGRLLAIAGMRRSNGRQPLAPSQMTNGQRSSAETRKLSPGNSRAKRRGPTSRLVRLATIWVLGVVLSSFGAFHLLLAVLGASPLLWPREEIDIFMPGWGKPGQLGSDLSHYPTDLTRDVLPIPCHSHNDYWRRIPLYEALHYGCTSVEADVWLYDNELYVGHSTGSLTPNRTLNSLYINPLMSILKRMNPSTAFGNTTGHGVFDVDASQPLVLLIDLKTSGVDTFAAVSQQLQPLRDADYLTHWNGTALNQRAITVVGTGNTPFSSVTANKTYRNIFFDAPLASLHLASSESQNPFPYDASNSLYASASFTQTIGFVWFSQLSDHQLDLLRGLHRGAHAAGLKVRWWDTPSWPIGKREGVWDVLGREGADVLSGDDLKGMKGWMGKQWGKNV